MSAYATMSFGPHPVSAFSRRSPDALKRHFQPGHVNKSSDSNWILGDSPCIRRMLQRIELLAPTDANVLILGESATGKEEVASAIHAQSGRWAGPLIRVNCAAVPRDLFESEFFGHVRGAFAGAIKDRAGRFERANGGTLFLDEIGEIPIDLQGKLLRVLQEGQYKRLGCDCTRSADVRVIAATRLNLASEVRAGQFREDLYYCLNVIPIEVPSLSDHPADISWFAANRLEPLHAPFAP